jgi:hypothetical protein
LIQTGPLKSPDSLFKSNAYAKHVAKRFVHGAPSKPAAHHKARPVGMFPFIAAEPTLA